MSDSQHALGWIPDHVLTKYPHPIIPQELQVLHSGYEAVYGSYEAADMTYSWNQCPRKVVGLGRIYTGAGSWEPCVLDIEGRVVLASSVPFLRFFRGCP